MMKKMTIVWIVYSNTGMDYLSSASEGTWIPNVVPGEWALSFTPMMTSSNGNIFRVTGHLCGEFTGHRWILRTKASDAELWCFLWSAPEWRSSKQSWVWWFETPSHPLWRHNNALYYIIHSSNLSKDDSQNGHLLSMPYIYIPADELLTQGAEGAIRCNYAVLPVYELPL